jgi:hypothetical protein
MAAWSLRLEGHNLELDLCSGGRGVPQAPALDHHQPCSLVFWAVRRTIHRKPPQRDAKPPQRNL